MELRTDMTFLEMLDATAKIIPCVKASRDCLERCRKDYHKSIESDLERTLYLEEMEIADIAFKYAFAEGWFAHKKEGKNAR